MFSVKLHQLSFMHRLQYINYQLTIAIASSKTMCASSKCITCRYKLCSYSISIVMQCPSTISLLAKQNTFFNMYKIYPHIIIIINQTQGLSLLKSHVSLKVIGTHSQ